ncbi:MAG TPA: major capsid protein [archaeon]|nr:major capsid protein [archaeon]
MNTNVDLVRMDGMASQGEVANQLLVNNKINLGNMRPFIDDDGKSCVTIYKGGNPKDLANYVTTPLNTNATLRRDEWKQLDDVLLDVSRQRLGGVQDLIDKGLVFNLGNAMGTTVLEWHDVSDAMEADLTMDGITRSRNDRPVYQHNYLPIPIIHVDYEINARVLAASRSLGNALDTTSAERAARRVLDKREAMLFTNITYSFGQTDSRGLNTIYSYINHPDRNPVTLAVQWDAAAITAALIMADVMEMVQTSIDNLHYGPWMLYIPTGYQMAVEADYNAVTPGTTIRERIMKIEGIKGVKVIDMLPAHNVLLVQMTSDVVRLVNGMGLQNIEWQEEGKFVTKYKVLAIQVPQIRSDQNLKSGVVHLA